MNKFNHKILLPAMVVSAILGGCNKDIPEATPIVTPAPTGISAMEALNDPKFSILKAAVTRAGLTAALSDKTAVYTIFAPDDDAFIASGVPAAAIPAFRPGQLDTLIKYHVVAGQEYKAAQISEKFPNNYWQSMFLLSAPSASLPPGYRMPICVSRRGASAWANNIPVKAVDLDVANGVIHTVARIVMPPSAPIWPVVNADPNYAYLKAAIQRADSGQAAASTLQGALNNAAANLTVFAPTNDAFQATLTGAITLALIRQGVPPATAQAQAAALASTPAVFSNPALYSVLTAQVVRGIVSYHVLGVRGFAVNLPAGSSAVTTIGGAALPQLQLRVALPLVEVRGPGNVVPGTTTPYYGKVVTGDLNFINGVVHVVDQVMLPMGL